MNKTALLFSGQGSQYVGMGEKLYDSHSLCREIYDQASEIFGFDVAKMSFDGSEEQIAQTLISQPLIFTYSIAAFLCRKEEFGDIVAVGGHSLGEYAALTAAEVFSLSDGFRVIKARASAMQDAAEKSSGAMIAIMGLSADTIEQVCNAAEGYVLPVNFNTPTQTVIAGDCQSVQVTAQTLADMGAKTVRLAVNSAFHSRLMLPAAEAFENALTDITFLDPKYPFYSNLDGQRKTEINRYYLAKHLISPVRFVQELQNIQSQKSPDCFYEVGPNKILSGLIKKTLKGVSIERVDG